MDMKPHYSLCLIIPYFGRFPSFFNLFLESCKNNPSIDWLLITDNTLKIDSSNIHVINMAFDELKILVQKKIDFQIALNTCGPGLSLAHRGTVIINSKSKVGNNCRIQTGVTLGASNGSDLAPTVGNNVFLGEGCKIIGNVYIPDNCNIGANAVVVKTLSEQGSYGGIPAKKISDTTSEGNVVKATEIVDFDRK